MRTTFERFWDKTQIAKTGCIEWTGYKNRQGYGVFKINGKTTPAHRYSWFISNGEIPSPLFVLHRCDNPGCINPQHLFLGTQKDNMVDCVSKNRKAVGIRVGTSKLTDSVVREIKTLLREGELSQREIGRRFAVSHTLIRDISISRIWKHIK